MKIGLCILGIIVIPIFNSAYGATVVQETLLESIEQSQLIVSGKVIGKDFVTNNLFGLLWKVAKVKVTKVYLNRSDFNVQPGFILLVSLLEGVNKAKGIGMRVPGAQKLNVGEDVVLQLDPPKEFKNDGQTHYVFGVHALSRGVLHQITGHDGIVRLRRQSGRLNLVKVDKGSHRVYGDPKYYQAPGKTKSGVIQNKQKNAEIDSIGVELDAFEALVEGVRKGN